MLLVREGERIDRRYIKKFAFINQSRSEGKWASAKGTQCEGRLVNYFFMVKLVKFKMNFRCLHIYID